MAWCRYAEASGTTLTQILKEPVSHLHVWLTYEAIKAKQAADEHVRQQETRQKWEYYAATIIAEIRRTNQYEKYKGHDKLNMNTELIDFVIKGDPDVTEKQEKQEDPYGGLSKEEYTARSKAKWMALAGCSREQIDKALGRERQPNGGDNGT